MISIAPLSVAGLMDDQVLDTDPMALPTYCIDNKQEEKGSREEEEMLIYRSAHARTLYETDRCDAGWSLLYETLILTNYTLIQIFCTVPLVSGDTKDDPSDQDCLPVVKESLSQTPP